MIYLQQHTIKEMRLNITNSQMFHFGYFVFLTKKDESESNLIILCKVRD